MTKNVFILEENVELLLSSSIKFVFKDCNKHVKSTQMANFENNSTLEALRINAVDKLTL